MHGSYLYAYWSDPTPTYKQYRLHISCCKVCRYIDSLTPGRCSCDLTLHYIIRVNGRGMLTKNQSFDMSLLCLWKEVQCQLVIFKLMSRIDIMIISSEIALMWIPQDDESTFVYVMDWCHQATSHYLSQCWPSFLTPYSITRSQWVKAICIHFHESVHHLVK